MEVSEIRKREGFNPTAVSRWTLRNEFENLARWLCTRGSRGWTCAATRPPARVCS